MGNTGTGICFTGAVHKRNSNVVSFGSGNDIRNIIIFLFLMVFSVILFKNSKITNISGGIYFVCLYLKVAFVCIFVSVFFEYLSSDEFMSKRCVSINEDGNNKKPDK